MEAQLVRKAVNRCAAQGKPFLFGVDFELREGFFVENPLVCRQIPFACGEITNVPDSFSGEAEITPRLEILHTDREAYLRRFAVIRRGLLRGDSFLTNLTERTPIRTNLTLDEIFRRSRARYKLLLPGRLVCFSPECFVRITDGVIRSYPMKGTIDVARCRGPVAGGLQGALRTLHHRRSDSQRPEPDCRSCACRAFPLR